MTRTWFYFSKHLFECRSSTLRVEGGRLLAKSGTDDVELMPSDIDGVEEFGFNNPFVLVTTKYGRFHVGAFKEEYDDVTGVLGKYLGDHLLQNWTHRSNVCLYRRRFSFRSIMCSLWQFVRRNRSR